MTGTRIDAIELLCPDPVATIDFYASTFGCRRTAEDDELRLGEQRLLFRPAGAPNTESALPQSTAFQHCAIVVSDMQEAMARLTLASGWTAISLKGPERLPEASGGATAFKFRDPDGHPLELIEFSPTMRSDVWGPTDAGPFLGIDHSAITVSDTESAVAFWCRLGFRVTDRHLNQGVEQARLDGIDASMTVVDVTTLMPEGGAPPHLELLRYVTPAPRLSPVLDGMPQATSLLLRGVHAVEGQTADPDGHRFRLLRT